MERQALELKSIGTKHQLFAKDALCPILKNGIVLVHKLAMGFIHAVRAIDINPGKVVGLV